MGPLLDKVTLPNPILVRVRVHSKLMNIIISMKEDTESPEILIENRKPIKKNFGILP